MRKVLISLAAVGTAVAFASPAAAQMFGMPQGYAYRTMQAPHERDVRAYAGYGGYGGYGGYAMRGRFGGYRGHGMQAWSRGYGGNGYYAYRGNGEHGRWGRERDD
ncbi:MAG: hypothetical protein V4502_09250 [Pseudomonadota bacterium]